MELSGCDTGRFFKHFSFRKAIDCGQPFIILTEKNHVRDNNGVIFRVPLHKAEDDIPASVWYVTEELLEEYNGGVMEYLEDCILELYDKVQHRNTEVARTWYGLFAKEGVEHIVKSCVLHIVRRLKWQQPDASDSTAQQSTRV